MVSGFIPILTPFKPVIEIPSAVFPTRRLINFYADFCYIMGTTRDVSINQSIATTFDLKPDYKGHAASVLHKINLLIKSLVYRIARRP